VIFGRRPGKFHGRLVEGEIDNHIPFVDGRFDPLAYNDTILGTKGQQPGILADGWTAMRLEGCGIFQLRMAIDHMGDSLAHSACRSGYYYLYHLCSFLLKF
jgi:hypothetical protein